MHTEWYRVSQRRWVRQRAAHTQTSLGHTALENNARSLTTANVNAILGTAHRRFEEQIYPLIALIFHPPCKLKKLTCVKGTTDYPDDLTAFKVINFFFFTFRQLKRRMKMADQSCTFSTDANAEKE